MSIVQSGFETHREIRSEQGFAVHVLTNDKIEIAVVPALGAKIISLQNRRTHREWMWHPVGPVRLFTNGIGDDFANSPLTGADECLPTVAPCSWQGRELPDHGEVWSDAWSVDRDGWSDGVLRTAVELKLSPLRFERTIELRDDEVRMHYRLTNHGTSTEPYLWALHPLLRLERDDRLELPDSTRRLLSTASWLDDLHTGLPGASAKVFASPLAAGVAAVRNSRTGDSLELSWDPAENNTLGIWLSCGGWHGHYQFALEPSSGQPDSLEAASKAGRCPQIRPGGSTTWWLKLRVGIRDLNAARQE